MRVAISDAGKNSHGDRLINIHDTGDIIRCVIIDGVLRTAAYFDTERQAKAQKYNRKKVRTYYSISGGYAEIE
jgi:hypothetical protein